MTEADPCSLTSTEAVILGPRWHVIGLTLAREAKTYSQKNTRLLSFNYPALGSDRLRQHLNGAHNHCSPGRNGSAARKSEVVPSSVPHLLSLSCRAGVKSKAVHSCPDKVRGFPVAPSILPLLDRRFPRQTNQQDSIGKARTIMDSTLRIMSSSGFFWPSHL